jgi:hypothetical protein
VESLVHEKAAHFWMPYDYCMKVSYTQNLLSWLTIMKWKGSLDNGYFDNFNNGFSNKYEKNRKKL